MSHEQTPHHLDAQEDLAPPGAEYQQTAESEHSYAELASALSDYQEIYHPDSALVQALQARVARLTDEGEPVPYVIAVKDSSINAFATADVLTIHDGVLDHIKTEEELDALILHEMKHISRGHTCQRNSRGTLGDAGVARKQEVEADVDALISMDEKGINPMGMFNLLDSVIEEDARLKERPDSVKHYDRFKAHSIPHGATNERKTTLEQILTIVDAKNLSDKVTPHSLEKGNTMITLSDVTPETPPPIKQALLKRLLTRIPAAEHHVAIQEEILEAYNPKQTPAVRRRQAELLTGYASKKAETAEQATEELATDLYVLSDPSLTKIIPKKAVSFMKGERMRKEVRALLKEGIVSATSRDIADLYRTFMPLGANIRESSGYMSPGRRNPILAALKDTLSTSPKEAHTAIANTCNTTLINTRFSFTDYVSVITDILKDKKFDLDEATLEEATVGDMDRRLSDLMRRQESPRALLDTIVNVSVNGIEDMEANSTHANLSVRGMRIATKLTESGEVDFAKELLADNTLSDTELAERVKVLREAALNINRPPDKELSWEDQLFLEVLSNNHDLIVDFIINEDIPEDLPPSKLTGVLLNRIKQVDATIQEVTAVRPDITDLTTHNIVAESTTLRQALLHDALTDLHNGNDTGDKLISLLQEHEIPRMAQGSFYRSPTGHERALKKHEAQLAALLEIPDWQNDERCLLLFAALGEASPSIELNLSAVPFAFRELARKRNLEECEALLDQFAHLQSAHSAILEVMMEEKAETHEDFERLNKLIKQYYTATVERHMNSVGAATLMDSVIVPNLAGKSYEREVGIKTDVIGGLKSSDILAALLSTGNDEHLLKLITAKQWWIAMRTSSLSASTIEEQFRVEDYIFKRGPAKKAILQHWLTNDYPANSKYDPFTSNVDKLYLLTNAGRFLAVRKLLLEKNGGALYNHEGTVDLVDALMSSWLQVEDQEESAVLRDLLLDLITKNDPSTTYMHIGPMLQDMILKPPKETAEMDPIYDSIAQTIVDTLAKKGRLPNPTEEDVRAIRTRVARLFLGSSYNKEQEESTSVDVSKQALTAIGVVDTETPERMSTIAFAALVGKKAGALGVKKLQLARQYFELSPEDEKEFEGIYDNMVGQSRLQAYNVLKREAEADPVCAELFGSITHFGKRIGGGSLFTVYHVETKDGRRLAVGVKNPNAEYRVARLAGFASTGLQATSQKHPENTTIQLMDTLLEDAVSWVQAELIDEDYAHKDTVFRAQNDTRIGQGFKRGSSRYDIVSPEPAYAESSWIRCETFVDGTNLSSLTVTDEPSDIPAGRINREDLKDATSLLVRNSIYQVMRGDYAHSDTHPGNYRVTADNSQVAIFDRHNLIKVTPELRQTVKAVASSIISGDPSGAGMAIASHSAGADADHTKLAQTIQAATEKSSEPTQLITNMLLELKRNGVRVPLDLSLVLRNFMSMAQFSQTAGFDNLAEAFMHTSTDPDEINWLFS